MRTITLGSEPTPRNDESKWVTLPPADVRRMRSVILRAIAELLRTGDERQKKCAVDACAALDDLVNEATRQRYGSAAGAARITEGAGEASQK